MIHRRALLGLLTGAAAYALAPAPVKTYCFAPAGGWPRSVDAFDVMLRRLHAAQEEAEYRISPRLIDGKLDSFSLCGPSDLSPFDLQAVAKEIPMTLGDFKRAALEW